MYFKSYKLYSNQVIFYWLNIFFYKSCIELILFKHLDIYKNIKIHKLQNQY